MAAWTAIQSETARPSGLGRIGVFLAGFHVIERRVLKYHDHLLVVVVVPKLGGPSVRSVFRYELVLLGNAVLWVLLVLCVGDICRLLGFRNGCGRPPPTSLRTLAA